MACAFIPAQRKAGTPPVVFRPPRNPGTIVQSSPTDEGLCIRLPSSPALTASGALSPTLTRVVDFPADGFPPSDDKPVVTTYTLMDGTEP